MPDSLQPHGLYSPSGSSVHEIFPARILEWVAKSSSRGSSQPKDGTHISCIGRQILYHWATWETQAPRLFQLHASFKFSYSCKIFKWPPHTSGIYKVHILKSCCVGNISLHDSGCFCACVHAAVAIPKSCNVFSLHLPIKARSEFGQKIRYQRNRLALMLQTGQNYTWIL